MENEFKCIKCHRYDLVIVRSCATIEYPVTTKGGMGEHMKWVEPMVVDYDSPNITSEDDEYELMCKHCGQVYGFRANDSLEYIYEIILNDEVLWKDPNVEYDKSDIIQKEIFNEFKTLNSV
mgnify:CR=1 FL=1